MYHKNNRRIVDGAVETVPKATRVGTLPKLDYCSSPGSRTSNRHLAEPREIPNVPPGETHTVTVFLEVNLMEILLVRNYWILNVGHMNRNKLGIDDMLALYEICMRLDASAWLWKFFSVLLDIHTLIKLKCQNLAACGVEVK